MSTNQSHRFGIDGMHCGGCVGSVTRAITALPGVASAEVSLAQREATVEFDSALVTPDAIRAAIEAAGYDVRAA